MRRSRKKLSAVSSLTPLESFGKPCRCMENMVGNLGWMSRWEREIVGEIKWRGFMENIYLYLLAFPILTSFSENYLIYLQILVSNREDFLCDVMRCESMKAFGIWAFTVLLSGISSADDFPIIKDQDCSFLYSILTLKN